MTNVAISLASSVASVIKLLSGVKTAAEVEDNIPLLEIKLGNAAERRQDLEARLKPTLLGGSAEAYTGILEDIRLAGEEIQMLTLALENAREIRIDLAERERQAAIEARMAGTRERAKQRLTLWREWYERADALGNLGRAIDAIEAEIAGDNLAARGAGRTDLVVDDLHGTLAMATGRQCSFPTVKLQIASFYPQREPNVDVVIAALAEIRS